MYARHVGLGIGAGLVSALLFAVVTTGSPPGVFLSYAAPLPVVIVALGWHPLLGLLAAFSGAFALSLVNGSPSGTAFAVGAALPAAALSWLALRPTATAGQLPPSPGAWLGQLLLAAAIASGVVVLIGAAAIGGGSHDAYRSVLVRLAESFVRIYEGVPRGEAVPDVAGFSGSAVAAFIAEITPALLGVVLTVVLALNLWAGARIVAMSGRLPRHWVPVRETRMPRLAIGLLVAAALASFGAGFVAVAGRALLGALVAALALQGFGFLHAVTRGRPGRPAVLCLAYMATAIAAGPILPLMALAGLADIATPIRRRLSRPPDGPGGPRPL